MRGCFYRRKRIGRMLIAAALLVTGTGAFAAAAAKVTHVSPKSPAAKDATRDALPDALPPEEWKKVEGAVDHGLAWLATQQAPDGSFPSAAVGQPGVTSLCVLAFVSRGHQPGSGPYGRLMNRAIDYVLKCQQSDGLISYLTPELGHVHLGASHTATYNHAIAGLMLSEIYGSAAGEQGRRVRAAIEQALRYTIRFQKDPRKPFPRDEGGWRYVRHYDSAFSDLSVTSWHLAFLRSARNAEFTVPAGVVESALEYVGRCFDEKNGLFYYCTAGGGHYSDRAMMGAGAVCFSLGGRHDTEMARRAGDWLLEHPFTVYTEGDPGVNGRGDRFHYSAYYCSQAMAQLGGRYWKGFFPSLARTLLEHQVKDGSWPSELGEDSLFGPPYTTALAVLTLTPPLQLLPIFQR